MVLTSAAAKSVGKTAGDRIVVSAGGRTAEYEIIGVASYPFPLVFMNWEDLSRQAGFVLGDAGTPDDPSDDPPVPTGYLVAVTAEDPSPAEVDDVIADISDTPLLVAMASFTNQVKEQQNMAGLMVFRDLQITRGDGRCGAIGPDDPDGR